jgi:hypothetical protein
MRTFGIEVEVQVRVVNCEKTKMIRPLLVTYIMKKLVYLEDLSRCPLVFNGPKNSTC